MHLWLIAKMRLGALDKCIYLQICFYAVSIDLHKPLHVSVALSRMILFSICPCSERKIVN